MLINSFQKSVVGGSDESQTLSRVNIVVCKWVVHSNTGDCWLFASEFHVAVLLENVPISHKKRGKWKQKEKEPLFSCRLWFNNFMAKANEWNLRWHCQLHDMKIGQNQWLVSDDFLFLTKWTQREKQIFNHFLPQHCSRVSSPIIANNELLRTLNF